MIPSKRLSTIDDYEELISQFCYLIDTELTELERCASQEEKTNFYDVIDELPKMICLIKTLGFLRGKDNSFSNILESLGGKHFSTEDFVHVEDSFEVRLGVLLDKVRQNAKYLAFFNERVSKVLFHLRSA